MCPPVITFWLEVRLTSNLSHVVLWEAATTPPPDFGVRYLLTTDVIFLHQPDVFREP